MCSDAKSKYFSNKIYDNSRDQKKLFQIADQLLYRKKTSPLPSHADVNELAEDFADYFTQKIEAIRDSFAPSNYVFKQNLICIPKLRKLEHTNQDELKKIILSANSKSCALDPIPTVLLKSCLDVLLPVLCSMVNKSFDTTSMPESMKTALVTPLLKKPSLDEENRKNYRPVSNLSYVSKLVERVAVKRINEHMTSHGLHEPVQSAYRKHHSVETALLKIYDDVLCAVDENQVVMLTLLDLSAAFDTVEHSILLRRLETEFGICDDALRWLHSYLSDRRQSVVVEGVRSAPRELSCGLPQGSLVGPFCFPPYTSHIGQIARKHDIKVHLYADDTQLYLAFDPSGGCSEVDLMMDCIEEVRLWMEANMLKLNDSKTEYMLLGSKNALKKVSEDAKSIKVGDAVVEAADSARNIGAIMDSNLNMVDHINKVTSSCYYHLWNISRIRKNLTNESTKTLIQAFVISKLDNMNSLLFGLPDKTIKKLQLVQNQAARIITRIGRYDHVTGAMINLHWLPVKYRIEYKICVLTFKCLHQQAPSYLSELVTPYVPSRSLRSADKGLLCEKRAKTKTYGERAFSICAPKLWNKLPEDLRSVNSLDSFKSNLKTHMFRIAYE